MDVEAVQSFERILDKEKDNCTPVTPGAHAKRRANTEYALRYMLTKCVPVSKRQK